MHFTDVYKSDGFLSMPREQVLLRLYDGLLRRLSEAERMLENGDHQGAGRSIGKALAIVTALREALDPTVEADAVPLLDQLYGTVSHWLLEANLNRSAERISTSRRIVTTLKEGWDGAVSQIR